MKRFDEDDLDRTLEGLRTERLPFAQGDYASMRRGVWREVEARPHGLGLAWSWRLGAGALTACAILAAWLLGRAPRPDAAARLVVPPPQTGPAAALEVPPVVVRLPSPVRRPHRPLSRVPDSAPVQIEFQTANPNVRIIWLVKKVEEPPRPITRDQNEEVS